MKVFWLMINIRIKNDYYHTPQALGIILTSPKMMRITFTPENHHRFNFSFFESCISHF